MAAWRDAHNVHLCGTGGGRREKKDFGLYMYYDYSDVFKDYEDQGVLSSLNFPSQMLVWTANLYHEMKALSWAWRNMIAEGYHDHIVATPALEQLFLSFICTEERNRLLSWISPYCLGVFRHIQSNLILTDILIYKIS